jgi:hypothetical protein
MDPTDIAWRDIESCRVMVGIDVPSLGALRAAVSTIARQHPKLGLALDQQHGRHTSLTEPERVEWPSRLVRQGPQYLSEPAAGFDHDGGPLGTAPLRLTVGDNWCSLRMAHAFGDGWSSLTVLGHLLAQATSTTPLPVPWRQLRPTTRDLVLAGWLARRPGAVASALRNRRSLRGGAYEPEDRRVSQMQHTTLFRVSPPAFTQTLRHLRDSRWPEASLASMVLVGVREEVGRQLPDPVPGTEVVFDTRGASPATERAFGNYAAGVFVRPTDDLDPAEVAQAMTRARDRGLPIVASAATRRRSRAPYAGRQVAAPTGRPRFAFSFQHGRGPASRLPWRDGERALALSSTPNGSDTITVSCQEVEDQLHLSLSFYDCSWPSAVVGAAIERFYADPFGPRRTLPRRAS